MNYAYTNAICKDVHETGEFATVFIEPASYL